MTGEWWIGKDLEESGHGIILMYYPGIRLERLRKIPVGTAGLRAVIWTQELLNITQ
jgi:hypothetical protein